MATADTNRALTGNTGSLLSRAFGQKGVAMTSSTFAILSSKIFGEFSRFQIVKVRDRFNEIWFHVVDAEAIDPVTNGPAIVRQEKSFTKAMEGLDEAGEVKATDLCH